MTLEQIKAMTDEALRIRVAELLGWKDIHVDWDYFDYCDCRDDTGLVAFDKVGYTHALPDYPADLNACHIMEESLTEDQCSRYGNILHRIWKDGDIKTEADGLTCHTTARQRCEAFVLTMEKV